MIFSRDIEDEYTEFKLSREDWYYIFCRINGSRNNLANIQKN